MTKEIYHISSFIILEQYKKNRIILRFLEISIAGIDLCQVFPVPICTNRQLDYASKNKPNGTQLPHLIHE